MNINQFHMVNSNDNGVEDVEAQSMFILHRHIMRSNQYKYILIPTRKNHI